MDDLIQQGVNVYKSGDKDAARKLFIMAVKQYPDAERAWGWMYNVCHTDKERIHCLKQMLRINPGNEKATQMLRDLDEPNFPFEQTSSYVTPQQAKPARAQKPPLSPNHLPIISMGDVGEYVKSIVLSNERVLAVAKIHGVVYIIPTVFTFLAIVISLFFLLPLIIGLYVGASSSDTPTFGIGSFLTCILPFWVIAGFGFLRAFLIRKFTEFAVTDKRIIGKVGIIRRSSLELLLNKVESIGVSQGLMGRLFDYGTLVISGSGGTHQTIPFIAKPMKLKQTINSILSE